MRLWALREDQSRGYDTPERVGGPVMLTANPGRNPPYGLVTGVGCGDQRRASDAQVVADRRPTDAGVLPCTDKDEPTNFDAYSVGSKFEGLPLVHQGRRCTVAQARRTPHSAS